MTFIAEENRRQCFVQPVKQTLNFKLTIELNSSKFLDTKLTNVKDFHKFNVYRKSKKLP